MHKIQLKKGRESSVLRHHPWIFSGAVHKLDGDPSAGDLVKVISMGGAVLGIGAYSPQSQIRVRLFSFADEVVDNEYLSEAVGRAIDKRKHLANENSRSAYRLIYGESDGLPGLVVDRYGDFLVCQFLFVGMERCKKVIVEMLAKHTACRGIYERSDVGVRQKEGLEKIAGPLWGEVPPAEIIIAENELEFAVDVIGGQKTGFYLDQVDNRGEVQRLSMGKQVLNCFSYTGGFSVAALRGGADHVTSLDSSAPALKMAGENVERNGFSWERHELVNGNVFDQLRQYQADHRLFDMVVLDPPKLAENKSQVNKAARAYKDLALQAARLLHPGGILVTFSCSGGIDLNLFQKITADALLDARCAGEVIRYLHQSEDHPVALGFPESQYLKGLVCRVF
ncbi:MAG: class I SAM-dependent rRNA methyltransferase [Pseudohongiellaceae bacterium]